MNKWLIRSIAFFACTAIALFIQVIRMLPHIPQEPSKTVLSGYIVTQVMIGIVDKANIERYKP